MKKSAEKQATAPAKYFGKKNIQETILGLSAGADE